MNEITQIIIEYASMWAPALGAIVGIAVMIIAGLAKVTKTINDFRADKTLANLNTAIEEQNNRLNELCNDNKELARINKAVVDKLYHINDYVEAKKREEGLKKNGNSN